MIVIGIDPGSIVTGIGIVQQTQMGLRLVTQCEIRTRAYRTFNDKLKKIYDEILKLVALYSPTHISLETIFFSNNVQSALKLGHVRGCVLALAISQNLNILEYSPKQVKRIITGNGNASKEQVAYMVRIKLHPSTSEFSRIAYGWWRLLSSDALSTKNIEKRINTCLENNITTFDHADIYGSYQCEAYFGRVLKQIPSLRNQIELVTKSGIKLVHPDFPERKRKIYDLHSTHIVQSLEASLRKFGTDYVDVLLIHRPNPLCDFEDCAKGLTSVVETGKAKYVGVSNFSAWEFETLQSFLSIQLVTNQLEISLCNLKSFTDGSLHKCIERRATPMAWSPLGGGKMLLEPYDELGRKRLDMLVMLSRKYECNITQLALAWLLLHPANILPIIGTNQTRRIAEASYAVQIKLGEEDWFELWEVSTGARIP
ncbi:hypothetical protein CHS0354_000501 [Potamilus streckersoni]|uniref:NADP-dependent oxidoreductase domain-containing protein n=1 Tax=Potamilus streckersoni TaxID=2493646 RepID=A0AAE0T6U1_9BIVA|nr:hypothetical protein CHS0354_000501 [Potamilus streckersoni]